MENAATRAARGGREYLTSEGRCHGGFDGDPPSACCSYAAVAGGKNLGPGSVPVGSRPPPQPPRPTGPGEGPFRRRGVGLPREGPPDSARGFLVGIRISCSRYWDYQLC
ncbi:hypothetical protein OsI_00637 [Oryza sativa Indica Group]|uniref:Uncharacterized protein n=1 Tax=Oryza sativa subsp. indica TaxID=39946 RepID=A2WLC8_ORYSI|nr:hypothetical protein OsI_00637 [Oryza sativa Indica Group]